MTTNYGDSFYNNKGECGLSTPEIIMNYVINRLNNIDSVIDFGCGRGDWLKAARKCGVNKLLGLDGEYAMKHFVLEPECFRKCDLTTTIAVDKKYDLAISVEVGEHIGKSKSEIYVKNITEASDIVLFSAAIPYQGGNGHINEQYPDYWKKIFEKFGFRRCDCIRNEFWDNSNVKMFYKQNMYLFYKKGCERKIESCFGGLEEERIPVAIHPEMWDMRNKKEYVFPFGRIKENSKVVLYGTGRVGQIFYKQLKTTGYAEVILWVDSAWELYKSCKYNISDPDAIKNIQYDYIVICAERESVAREINDILVNKMGICENKTIWIDPIIKE